LLFFLVSLSYISKADVTKTNHVAPPSIRNCFQEIMFGDPGPLVNGLYGDINFLKGDFWFSPSPAFTGQFNTAFFAFDVNGNPITLDLVEIGLTDGVTYPVSEVLYDPLVGGSYLVDMIDLNWNSIFNQNRIFLPANVDVLIIRELTMGSNGEYFTYSGESMELNFMEMDDAFTFGQISTRDDNCVTFDNFSYALDIDLYGFCGNINLILKNPADNSEINLGSSTSGTPTLPDTWNDHCPGPEQVIFVQPRPNVPVPWGCKDFFLDLVVTPCENLPGYEHCENIEISKEIEICCSCDIRQPLDAH
jgi:hypothetical protein